MLSLAILILQLLTIRVSHTYTTSDTSSIGISEASELAPQVLRISITNLARHDDNLDSIRHDETNGDRTSDY